MSANAAFGAAGSGAANLVGKAAQAASKSKYITQVANSPLGQLAGKVAGNPWTQRGATLFGQGSNMLDAGKDITASSIAFYNGDVAGGLARVAELADNLSYGKPKLPKSPNPKVAQIAPDEARLRQLQEIKAKRPPAAGPYSHLDDHPSVGPGKNFTQSQKKKILAENQAKNNGDIRDDRSGEILQRPQKHQKGVTPPNNEAHIDHVDPKSLGGTNSFGNAEVRSRLSNLQKGNRIE